jgi:uncharacterized membrane protein
MATDPSDLYPVIAQIAAAFAGFGSLATSIGQRRGGDDARIDAARLAQMLVASVSATLLGLLPATLASFGLSERWALGLSALPGAVVLTAYAPIALRRAARNWHAGGYTIAATVANSACVLMSIVAFALCILGAAQDRIAALYLVGLMGLLASSIITFSRVIASMLRPHSN